MNKSLLRQDCAVLARTLVVSLLRLKEPHERLKAAGQQLASMATAAQLGNPAIGQILYAIKLASFDGSLIYEEVRKLFSLLEEIEALRLLGFDMPTAESAHLRLSVQACFIRDARTAHIVAGERAAEWNRDWWYYKILDAS